MVWSSVPTFVLAIWFLPQNSSIFFDQVTKISKSKLNKRFRDPRNFEGPREFKKIRQLDQESIDNLDKLRFDLRESIERTLRIQQVFVRQLRKETKYSERIKHILNIIDLIPFYCDSQQKILDRTITEVLDSKEKAAKELREEAERKEEERRKNFCYCDLD